MTTTDGVAWTWTDLVREFEPAIAAYSRSRGIREPDDVVQDVLVTAVRTLDDFDGDTEKLRSWLFMLAHRRIADRHRQFYRSPLILVRDHEPTPADDDGVDVELLRSEAVADAMAAFDILDERQRSVLHRRIIDERSPREVADELGLSPGNVRVIQSRALARVRRHLENRSRTRERTAAGVMVLVAAVRDLGSTLPRDGLVGAWIDQVRAAAATSGIEATGTTAAATAAAASPGGTAASSTAWAGQAAAAGGVAAKVGTAAVGLALAVGVVGGATDREVMTPSSPPAATEATVATVAVAGAPADPASVPTGLWPEGPVGTAAPVPLGVDDPAAPADAFVRVGGPGGPGGIAPPVAHDDAITAAGDGASPHAVSRHAVAMPLLEGVGDGLAGELVPSIQDLVAIAADLDLGIAGNLVLDPLTDTRDVVARLGVDIPLQDLAGSTIDTAADGLENRVSRTASAGDAVVAEGGRAVATAVEEGADRVRDVVDSLDARGGSDRDRSDGQPAAADVAAPNDRPVPSDPADTADTVVDAVEDTVDQSLDDVEDTVDQVLEDGPVDEVLGNDGVVDDVVGGLAGGAADDPDHGPLGRG